MRHTLPLRIWMGISHLLVLALPLLALVGTGALAHELQMAARGELIHQGAAIARLAAPALRTQDPQALASLTQALDQLERDTATRVQLIDVQGRIVVSSRSAELGLDLSSQAEVEAALEGRQGAGLRRRKDQPGQPLPPGRSELLQVLVSTPVWQGDEPAGAVLVTCAPRKALQAVRLTSAPFLLTVTLALLATVALSLASSHVLSRSLRALSRASRRISEGGYEAVEELARPGRSHVVEVGTLARDLATMAQRLRERLGYIREFAGNVSHEFKTPISTLKGTVELLRDDQDMEAAQRLRFLDNAQADLERMERLVSGLLALARAEEAGSRQPLELDEVVAALAQRHPELKLTGSAGPVQGNRAQLEAALENLVDNALLHGGDGVAVQLRAWHDEAWVGCDVVDDGPGISAANLPRIFDRFFTTGRERGSAGLGLALVRAICRAHGGEVSAESQPGRTCFRVALPRG